MEILLYIIKKHQKIRDIKEKKEIFEINRKILINWQEKLNKIIMNFSNFVLVKNES